MILCVHPCSQDAVWFSVTTKWSMCVEGQKAAAALVVLLVWRLARVVDGMTTYKYFLFAYLLTYCKNGHYSVAYRFTNADRSENFLH